MNEKVYYRLVHSGLYVQVMDSVFSQLIVESKMIYTVEEDPEAKQRHLDGLERYMAELTLSQVFRVTNVEFQSIYFKHLPFQID
ncbi:hypothetical protein [Lactococcus cremoris]|uniref:hypothetical protein n=1 Tax=Lactococcus lactis subsp. cremoris TaxID=1359 RepID=UPI002FC84AF5